jgi:hypothetical protein
MPIPYWQSQWHTNLKLPGIFNGLLKTHKDTQSLS